MELEALKWVLFTVVGVCGWLMRNMVVQAQEEIKTLKNDVIHLKEQKVSKDDFKEFKVELREMFQEIKTDIREIKSNHG